jgi:hypothetical protein
MNEPEGKKQLFAVTYSAVFDGEQNWHNFLQLGQIKRIKILFFQLSTKDEK